MNRFSNFWNYLLFFTIFAFGLRIGLASPMLDLPQKYTRPAAAAAPAAGLIQEPELILQPPLPSALPLATPTPPGFEIFAANRNGSRSILLVVVNDLQSAQPQLESIWLVAYMPTLPHLTFFSAYPTQAPGLENLNELLQESFWIENPGSSPRLPTAFLEHLSSKNIPWGGYILIDLPALEILSAGLNVDITPLHLTSEKTVLERQAHVFRELCIQAAQADQSEENKRTKVLPGLLTKVIPAHMSIGFDLAQFATEYQTLRSFGRLLQCQFPLEYSLEFQYKNDQGMPASNN